MEQTRKEHGRRMDAYGEGRAVVQLQSEWDCVGLAPFLK